jgi:hypothetical protein
MNLIKRITDRIALIYLFSEDRVILTFDGFEILTCVFIAVNIQGNPEKNNNLRSIDELVARPEARLVERDSLRGLLSPEEQLFAHASNLQAWIEHDYDTHLLSSQVSFKLLYELSESGDDRARRILDATIEERIVDGISSTRIALVENLHHYFASNHWDKLLNDPDPAVREKVARYIPLSPIRFKKIMDDNDPKVCDALGHRWHEEPFILQRFSEGSIELTYLRRLVNHPDRTVRSLAARYAHLPEEFMEILSNDRDLDVRLFIAQRLDLKKEILTKFMRDPDETIKRCIDNREKFVYVTGDPNPVFRKNIHPSSLINDKTPEKEVERIILYPSTPVDRLEWLLKEPKVANNPFLVSRIIQRITTTPIEQIRKAKMSLFSDKIPPEFRLAVNFGPLVECR